MIYVFAGTANIAANYAIAHGIPPKSKNVTLVIPTQLDKFRGRIVYEHDQIIWGDFPYGGQEECIQALAMARW